ncbi:hypothetical protein SAMN05421852_103162 [Thermoflavimicrobium dichotomicum]|uniref:Uncharacterized protein n=2 Tax=Thermoflavimicrobium dichotomicum TaxID=46223 RepID=A0A1I3MRH4_9BACL|nr:hypothetical protein SAMN05421852_103162 [Thermoflavimicrobium dichotomicum]
MTQPVEKLLIQTYRYINESRHLIEQAIDQLGQQHCQSIQHLPEDIQYLVQVALELTPDQRKSLRMFLEAMKQHKV